MPPDAVMEFDVNVSVSRGLFPRIDEYFGEWAMQEEPFRQTCRLIESMNLLQHMNQSEPESVAEAKVQATHRVDTGGQATQIAVISLTGTLMKQVSSFSGGTSTVAARRAIRESARDPSVGAILLRIDSPGGTVSGTSDLADDIREAAAQKPVWSYIEDLGASAAYWLASQTSRIATNKTALVGSIGTFLVVEDSSEASAKEGIKVHVIRAGEFKGAGVSGTPVTEKQLGYLQERVNSLNEHFLEGVSSGRKLPAAKVRELADGRVYIASEAKKIGLVDAVESFDETLRALSKQQRSKEKMTDTTTPAASETNQTAKPVAATFAEIVAACAGINPQADADAKFITAQLSQGVTVAAAQSAWMTALVERNKATEQALAEEKAKPGKSGHKPVTDNASEESDGGSDAQATVNKLVAEKVAAGIPRHEAVQQVYRENKDLRQKVISGANTRK